jgi:hypothetical protein
MSLGIGSREATVELGYCCALFEAQSPILGRPAVFG